MLRKKILQFFNIILIVHVSRAVCYEVNAIARTVTSYLEKYESYRDVVMIHLKVPEDTLFASFKFVAEETQLSIFGCTSRNISLYMKYGSPPAINPEGAPFPKNFKNITRSEIYNLEMLSDKQESYINISSPEPGPYYITTFLSYSDPKYNAIKQEGLSPSCFANVQATLSTKKVDSPLIISEGDLVEVTATLNESRYFKFFVPNLNDHAIMKVNDINFSDNMEQLLVRIDINKPPSEEKYQKQKKFGSNVTSAAVVFWTEPESWHYIELKFSGKDSVEGLHSNLTFRLKFFLNQLTRESSEYELLQNETFYNHSLSKTFHNYKITDVVPYKHYDLIREASSDSFLYSYELEQELHSKIAIPINMTNSHFSLLKFRIGEGTDIGGTLQFIMAFKPRVKRLDGSSRITFEEEPGNHVIIACIRRGVIEIPTWPNNCVSKGIDKTAQLVLNKTVENSTILIPYPESGTWYATFKLFCGGCQPCECPQSCQAQYEDCATKCDLDCVISGNCDYCSTNCSKQVIAIESCKGCDCDGPCLKNETAACNTSIIFDISSHPCIFGQCSRNGKCIFMVSDGVVFSTCVCINKYRGWDCSDGSQATPYYMVVIELLLLVLSNLMFLPAVYVAYKRKFYIEAITYFSICFFSTFYHACDAGEHILSYCLVRLSALQFGDFFCALLAIWVTLIAIADLPSLITPACHMVGAIVLSFCTTINKTALWIFALPVITGIAIISCSWYLKYLKVKQRFANRRYLFYNIPIGTVVVFFGLVLYAFLQTEDNYKYLHSVWHVVMAVALIIVLPEPNTFLPEVLL
ncbi:post-GPI attachment to proteins factor 6 [Leptinotarsa decemlineata]|uniref:post-GPI attachment to proteins factor 6 n=1 Tax=Leptinotarsa decemlineata TaxID=7539 RepID=UPI003D305F9D